MGQRGRVSGEVKKRVLKKIQEEGETAVLVAKEEGINVKTIYSWLRKETEVTVVSWSQFNKMKRENQQLKEIIGHLTFEMKKPKKS
jgi:transposase-like protein